MESGQKSGYRLEVNGPEVTRLRLEKRLTRAELAAKADVSTGRLNKIEGGLAGYVSVTTVRALADVLGCEPDDISEVVEVPA